MTDIKLRLNSHETGVLRDLVEQMRALLKESESTDPVHSRLFPSAYEDDREAEGFRDMTSGDLAAMKLEALDTVEKGLLRREGAGRRVTLTQQEAEAWARALTDMRLAIGTRLDVTEQTMSSEPDEDDPGYGALQILHWLGWLQESILKRMTP